MYGLIYCYKSIESQLTHGNDANQLTGSDSFEIVIEYG